MYKVYKIRYKDKWISLSGELLSRNFYLVDDHNDALPFGKDKYAISYAKMAIKKLGLDINEVAICSINRDGEMPFFPQLGFIKPFDELF